jgi:hypothetical protein
MAPLNHHQNGSDGAVADLSADLANRDAAWTEVATSAAIWWRPSGRQRDQEA